MANILLPQQTIKVADLQSQFPARRFKTRKIFFQCELRRVEANGDAVFRIIGYAAWRKNNNDRIPWNIGAIPARGEDVVGGPVLSHPVDNGDPDPAKRHVAFGNNEIRWPYIPGFQEQSDKEKDQYYEDDEKDPKHETEFAMQLGKILMDKEKLTKSFLNFKGKISENPHLTYDVTLDSGGIEIANPCPPNQPGEG